MYNIFHHCPTCHNLYREVGKKKVLYLCSMILLFFSIINNIYINIVNIVSIDTASVNIVSIVNIVVLR